MDNKKPTSEMIELLFNNFQVFLKEKNRRYGDSASNPEKVFSFISAETQIANRIDDKLARIKNRPKDTKPRKNDVCDVFGYIALYMIQNGWITFDDLLD